MEFDFEIWSRTHLPATILTSDASFRKAISITYCIHIPDNILKLFVPCVYRIQRYDENENVRGQYN